MTELFYPGSCETLKRLVHQCAFGCCVLIGSYSLVAFLLRRERHLLVNLALSIAVGAVESQNVKSHQKRVAR